MHVLQEPEWCASRCLVSILPTVGLCALQGSNLQGCWEETPASGVTANCCIGIAIRSLLRKMMSAKPVPLSQAELQKHHESKCHMGTQWVL